MTETTNPTTEREVLQLQREVLSGLPGAADFEQGAEIEERQDRGELIELNGAWYERVDLNTRSAANIGEIYVEGLMPEKRPDVADRRNVVWSWECEDEAYVSRLGEVHGWNALLARYGPLIVVNRHADPALAAAARQREERAEAEARPHDDGPDAHIWQPYPNANAHRCSCAIGRDHYDEPTRQGGDRG